MADLIQLIKKARAQAPNFIEHTPPDLRKAKIDFRQDPIPRNITSTLAPYTGPWTASEVAHLLRRTMFGVKKADLDYFKNRTLTQALDEILTLSPDPAPPINDYNTPDLKDPQIPYGETWINHKWSFTDFNNPDFINILALRLISFKTWWIKQQMNQKRNIHEKMILFWHNHIPVESNAVFVATLNYNYQNILRHNALGNFKKMVREITVDPAMLIYLNGTENKKQAPDENYARELQELFVMGKGPDSHYTEEDVKQAARILTGWTLNIVNQKLVASFVAFNHDNGDKQFSSFYNNRKIKGRFSGNAELDELLDMLFNTQEAARFICRKLYRFFVYPEIDEFTENNIIRPLAKIFKDGDYEILPVLQTLFASEHFFDVMNRSAMITTPLDMIVGFWRTMDMSFPQNLALEDLRQYSIAMFYMPLLIGMELGDPPSVSGWPAYYQHPIYDKSWITNSTIKVRSFLTNILLTYGLFRPDEKDPLPVDILGFVAGLDHPEDPNKLIDEVNVLFMGYPMTEEEKKDYKDILLSGQQSDYYWTNAWNNYIADPNDQAAKQIVYSRLQSFFVLLFQLAEYHMM